MIEGWAYVLRAQDKLARAKKYLADLMPMATASTLEITAMILHQRYLLLFLSYAYVI